MTSPPRAQISMLGSLVRIIFSLFALLLIGLGAAVISREPSNSRDWSADQERLPYAEFQGDRVTVRNIRNFSYESRDVYSPGYYDRTYDLRQLESVDYIVEPLASIAAAHTFLSFGFSNGSHLAISIEIRKEKGEEFKPLRGLFREYELMYVIVDERDTLAVRAIHRDNPVYIYPARVTSDQGRALLTDMLKRANSLLETPEFYNTLTNTCATNIVDHINALSPDSIGFDWRILLPLDSDELAQDLGYIDSSVTIDELRRRYFASDLIKKYIGDPAFSEKIRSELPNQ